jgi:carboxyl-terminal processing protease
MQKLLRLFQTHWTVRVNENSQSAGTCTHRTIGSGEGVVRNIADLLTARGPIPRRGAPALLPRVLPHGMAMQMQMTGEPISAQRLLLDLRGNPGGGIGNLRLMSLFTLTRQPVGYSLDRATAESGTPKERLPRLGKIPSQKWELIPLAVRLGTKKSVVLETEGLGPQPFHGHIVTLVNEHTTGAAEMVTLFAKENSLATIVGTKTPGRLISRTGTKVGAGYHLVFPIAAYQSWNGTRIEGQGIEPDIRVAWSFEDAQRGEDAQLDRAFEVLRGR